MYLAVLGRQPEISVAELEAQYHDVKRVGRELATFAADEVPDIDRLGGTMKIAVRLQVRPVDFLRGLAAGKITFGVSDYSSKASQKSANLAALQIKKSLTREGRSVRMVVSNGPTISTATTLHNGMSGRNPRKVELIRVNQDWYQVIGVQDIDAYARRDQARPARDARVGMLPPKLAQILINLCGPLEPGATVLDPFCGTGVVLQEALLMGYVAYGTDIEPRMVEYSEKNLKWLCDGACGSSFSGISERGSARISAGRPWRRAGRTRPEEKLAQAHRECDYAFRVQQGDATTVCWDAEIDAVACEGYLGVPMSAAPAEIKLKAQKQECGRIMLGFLRNLAGQVRSGTPVVVAMPAWLRPDGNYSRLEILDEIEGLGYNINNKSREGLLYYRSGQVVARDIIILRKK